MKVSAGGTLSLDPLFIAKAKTPLQKMEFCPRIIRQIAMQACYFPHCPQE